MPTPQPFTRGQSRDPETNRLIQDLYDKLQQAQAAITDLQSAGKKTSDAPSSDAFSAPLVWTPFTGFRSNWQPTAGYPSYCVYGNLILFKGSISGGTTVDGTVLFGAITLPRLLKHPLFRPITVNNGAYVIAHLSISTTGIVSIYGAPIGTTTLYLDMVFVLE